MTGEPARQHDNLAQLKPATVPFAEYERLQAEYEKVIDELSASRRALGAEHRRAELYRKRLEDATDTASDAQEIKRFLAWWRDYTGRPHQTRIDLRTGRAQLLRKAYGAFQRTYGDETWRMFAYAVIGCHNDPWWRERGLTDIKSVFPTGKEDRTEKFIEAGMRIKGVQPRQEAA